MNSRTWSNLDCRIVNRGMKIKLNYLFYLLVVVVLDDVVVVIVLIVKTVVVDVLVLQKEIEEN